LNVTKPVSVTVNGERRFSDVVKPSWQLLSNYPAQDWGLIIHQN